MTTSARLKRLKASIPQVLTMKIKENVDEHDVLNGQILGVIVLVSDKAVWLTWSPWGNDVLKKEWESINIWSLKLPSDNPIKSMGDNLQTEWNGCVCPKMRVPVEWNGLSAFSLLRLSHSDCYCGVWLLSITHSQTLVLPPWFGCVKI